MKNLVAYYEMALKKNNPYFAMIIVQLVYAGMALLSKAAVAQGMNPYVFVAYRQAFATFALAPFAFLLDSNKAPLSYKLLCKIFLVSLFGMTLCLNLYYLALTYTTATLAAATTNTIPAITFVMAVISRAESVSIKQWHGMAKVLGSVSSVSGAFVFAFVRGPQINFMNWSTNQIENGSPSMQTASWRGLVIGALIMLSANTIWSLWLIMQAPLVRQYPATLRLTALQCFFSCIQSTIWAMAMERNISSWKLGWDLNLISVAYCGVIVAGMSYWLQLWAVEKKGPVFTVMFTPLALVVTAIVSAFLWKEILHLGSVCGAILLVGGLYCVLWGKNKEAQIEANQQKSVTKEETLIECVTHR